MQEIKDLEVIQLNDQFTDSGTLKKQEKVPIPIKKVLSSVVIHPQNPDIRYFEVRGLLGADQPTARITYKGITYKNVGYTEERFTSISFLTDSDIKNASKNNESKEDELLKMEKILVTNNGFTKTGGKDKNDPIRYFNEELGLEYELTSTGRNVISFNPHENNFYDRESCRNWRSGKTLKAFNKEVQESIEILKMETILVTNNGFT